MPNDVETFPSEVFTAVTEVVTLPSDVLTPVSDVLVLESAPRVEDSVELVIDNEELTFDNDVETLPSDVVTLTSETLVLDCVWARELIWEETELDSPAVICAAAGVATTIAPTRATADTLTISRHFWVAERVDFLVSVMATGASRMLSKNRIRP